MDDLSSKQLAQLKHQELKLHQEKLKIVQGLPHRFGWKWYGWARTFYESVNKVNLLCASNQSTKSSCQIRKCIEWATNKDLWPKLWKNRPQQFWYLYPSKDVAHIEFEKKWIPEFLPRGEFKDHPTYGWKEELVQHRIHAIHFFSGVSLYFKTYSQDPQTLQSSSVAAIFTDEELPIELFPELQFRLAATDGYFHMVFTATLNQDFWRRAIERLGCEDEVLKDALKLQVSMYDCLAYEDGTPGHYTEERIEKIKAVCPSDMEIQRRVYGRFIKDEGRMISSFTPSKHMIKPFPIHHDMKIYSGVDIGSGGTKGHPAAITFVAVEPNFRTGYVFKGWRGDGVVTASSDIVDKWAELKGGMMPVLSTYDWQSKDFYIVASRMGHSFVQAQKDRARGQDLLNTLFRNDMLFIFEDGELQKLSTELMTINKNTHKSKAVDDFYDSLKFAVASIPWDFSHLGASISDRVEEKEIENKPLTDEALKKWELEERMAGFGKGPRSTQDDAWRDFEEELDFWNQESGN